MPKDAYPLPHVKGLNVASEASHELAEQMNESRSTPRAHLRSPDAEYPALQEGWHEDPSGKMDGQDPESPFNSGPDAPLHEGPLDGVYAVPFIVVFVGGGGPPVGPRPRGETAEEKRARKAAVKEHRALRRQEKKNTKRVFVSEETKLRRVAVASRVDNASAIRLHI